MTTSLTDGHDLVWVKLICWCSTNVVLRFSCFLCQSKPSLHPSRQTIRSVMVKLHRSYVYQNSVLFNQICEHAEPSYDIHFACLLDTYLGLPSKSVCDPFICINRVGKDVKHCCFPYQCHIDTFWYDVGICQIYEL